MGASGFDTIRAVMMALGPWLAWPANRMGKWLRDDYALLSASVKCHM